MSAFALASLLLYKADERSSLEAAIQAILPYIEEDIAKISSLAAQFSTPVNLQEFMAVMYEPVNDLRVNLAKWAYMTGRANGLLEISDHSMQEMGRNGYSREGVWRYIDKSLDYMSLLDINQESLLNVDKQLNENPANAQIAKGCWHFSVCWEVAVLYADVFADTYLPKVMEEEAGKAAVMFAEKYVAHCLLLGLLALPELGEMNQLQHNVRILASVLNMEYNSTALISLADFQRMIEAA